MKRPIEYQMRFTKAERLGLLIILSLFLLIYASKSIYNWQQDQSINMQSIYLEDTHPTTKDSLAKAELGAFNPNTVSAEELSNWKLPEKTIRTWMNYRIKGGKFRKKEDVKKLYHLTEADYARIEEHLVFPDIPPRNAIEPKKQTSTFISSKWRDSLFNPNEIEAEKLQQMGFDRRVSERWTKYVKKGGRFRKEEDLLKLYNIDSALVKSWSKNWVFPTSDTIAPNLEKKKPIYQMENISLEINAASEAEWQYLPGIGPGYAKRIVQFRSKLGGFYTIEQIAETFGLPDSVFHRIKPFLILNQEPAKIKINLINAVELANHPYFPKRKANLLVNYRDQHGVYLNIESIYKIQVLDPVWLEKIKPYLDFSTH